ncbi:serine/threonine protein kinase [Pirellula staleyi DSM 6068]|uniref:non-specific serine/threonine protein kinase n=1 Tax=Pirellula staleyi (strain ATCC 27377 / DSM 6068 / ICPB 4128) TaxID=530564 RepID=D2R162_PIRSD|nr:serine/threonine-protein kinase [Pirellula staleyi]ADB18547.1 serine/threonine protein kinase [Pirellula staleyi DSM 6068]
MAIEKLGPFRLEKMLGRGGMGAVYVGRHIESEERVAVKVLVPMLADDEPFRERFKGEVEALKKLLHPNIVRLQGYGEDEGHLYYVMELVEGKSLQEELSAGRRFNWREVTRIGVEIARALKHAHDRGIVHRDLKPANLMLDKSDQVKLTDFGIAKLYGNTSMTSDGSVMGTADYMAPEQAEGKNTTSRCDLYSLGSVLHALLCGKPPFHGRSLPEVLERLRKEPPIPIRRLAPDTPEELESIILQLLEKDPSKRIPTAVAVANRLKAMEHALSLETRPLPVSKDEVQEEGELRLAPLAPSTAAGAGLDKSKTVASKVQPPRGAPNVAQVAPGARAVPPAGPTGPMPAAGDADYRIEGDGLALTGVFTPSTSAVTRGGTGSSLPSLAGEMPTMITAEGNPSLLNPAPPARSRTAVAPSDEGASLAPLEGASSDEPQLAPVTRSTHFTQVTEAQLRHGERREEADESPMIGWLKVGAMLLLATAVVVAGVYFATRQATADQLAARIEAAAADEDPLKLAEAEQDLVNFIARFPEDSRVEAFRKLESDLELFRLQRRFELRARRPSSSEGLLPVERAYLEVLPLIAADPPLAAERLAALLVIFDQTSVKDLSLVESRRIEQCLQLARQQLTQLRSQNAQSSSSTGNLLAQKLAQAKSLESSDPTQSRAIYEAIIKLYGDRSYAAPSVSEARDRLSKLPSPPLSSSEDAP